MSAPDAWNAAAHHEAGHCVTALVMGAPVTELGLEWARKWGRRVSSGWVTVDDSFTDPFVCGLISAAGPIAEAKWGAHRFAVTFANAYKHTANANSSDATMLRRYARSGRLRRQALVTEAAALVNAHWSAVERIAHHLAAKHKLDGRQAARLL